MKPSVNKVTELKPHYVGMAMCVFLAAPSVLGCSSLLDHRHKCKLWPSHEQLEMTKLATTPSHNKDIGGC